ncbi:MAG: glycosyltransferase family 4 protein [Acidobacteriota bacterium]|nr:glycosyltransferase family 4 protein [Acidobacteriota bacterium]
MIVVDADFLGRRRTGDETYVRELLRALPRDLDVAAVTRRPDLVPGGVRAIELDARVQELRMLWTLPRLLRRLHPSLAHFVHAIPPRLPCPAVLTVQDLSFERDPATMGARERAIFRRVVPWSARRAAHVFAISERTRDDLVELYRIPEEMITVTPLAPAPEFRPADGGHDDYLLFVSSIEPRKDPLAALAAARAMGMRLVAVGPQRDAALVAALRAGGADVRGYVATDELVRLYQRAACLVHPSLYEGFALTPAEAMACGTPVVARPDAAVRELVGDAGVLTDDLAAGIREALERRDELRTAGLERARRYTWKETARLTADVYRSLA